METCAIMYEGLYRSYSLLKLYQYLSNEANFNLVPYQDRVKQGEEYYAVILLTGEGLSTSIEKNYIRDPIIFFKNLGTNIDGWCR